MGVTAEESRALRRVAGRADAFAAESQARAARASKPGVRDGIVVVPGPKKTVR
jgi:acetyl-CoA acetyltransferase